eukprot:CAMPEP_0116027658 /NCGR_PEP_ID=MMETSP0321-20121206/14808_1 /TAXON_ID=163516 /ORGANISM="Leptocylindrus danicus var. danicus, Strain B650" /LENGTH=327 /DNA_ID=CAMNT_0003501151 /DNA_START=468 /DNA_END=1451 /DNA_ORIENTATION=+
MPTPLRCDPKLFEKDLSSQIIIVTGANSGIGLETSSRLVKQKATVILACRNVEKGEAAAKEVGGVFLAPMDLASLQSVRDFVKTFLEKYDRLDVLVNNAGIMACPYGKTKDGFETQIGCNHLGHFLLQQLLTPILLKTADETGKPSRFLALSSCAAAAMTMGADNGVVPEIDFDDLNFEKRDYSPGIAYGQSKLANYLHALEASSRYPADKLISVSCHPGWVRSNLDVHAFKAKLGDGIVGRTIANIFRKLFIFKGDMLEVEDGCQASMYCILSDDLESGKFYSQIGSVYVDVPSRMGGFPLKLPNENATPENAKKLWELSEKLVGV